jgi:hypothetical protein
VASDQIGDVSGRDADTGMSVDTGHTDTGADSGSDTAADTGMTCPTSEQNCGGVCVNLSTNAQHCGSCGNDCMMLAHVATAVCTGGTCAISQCRSDYGNCDTNDGNGCETHLTSTSDCGACGTACSGTDVCAMQTTGYGCEMTCTSGTMLCAGTCIDTTSDLANCGGCGAACPVYANASSTCSGSSCSYACNNSYRDCGGGVCVHGSCP